MQVEECTDKGAWDEVVMRHDGHPLQLWGWGEVKATNGWKTHRYIVKDGSEIRLAAQVLTRKLPFPFRQLAYIPRGPLFFGNIQSDTFHVKSEALEALTFHVNTHLRPLLLKVEPDAQKSQLSGKWRISRQTIQAPQTVQLDLTKTEEELLADMSKKTRQYIRKSSTDVSVVELDPKMDLKTCLDIYRQTSERAHFPLHKQSYYQAVADEMADNAKLYGAKVEDVLVAFLWISTSGHTSYELYGGMTSQGQELRANNALKWYAIRQMKNQGVKIYDFGGLVGTGVSTYKKGWTSETVSLVGAIDYPMSSWYWVWAKLYPALKRIRRVISSKR